MQIKVNLKIFIFIIIFLIINKINIYSLIMLFAILHELGHLICGLIFRFKVEKISILPVGVSMIFKVPIDKYNEKVGKASKIELNKIIISLAGPLTNFLIALIFYICNFKIFENQNMNIIYSNILIGVFNLIPIYPLDGGRILKGYLHIIVGNKKSIIATNVISNITLSVLTAISSIAILYFKNISILIIIAYLWIIVIKENSKYKMKLRVYKLIEENSIIN